MQYFGLTPSQLPAIRIIQLHGMFKYKYDGPVTEDNLVAFIKQYIAGKILVGGRLSYAM